MAYSVTVFDPTATDNKSKVRGIGRYLQLLKTYFGATWKFTDARSVAPNSIYIHPFYNLIGPSKQTKRKGKRNIAVIHDIIPLMYPNHFPLGIKAKWSLFWNKRHIARYDSIVTDSVVSKKRLIEYLKISEKKIHVVYPTVLPLYLPHIDSDESHHHPFHVEQTRVTAEFTPLDLKNYLPDSVASTTNSFVLYVGDGTWNKNLPNLAKAIKIANVPCVCVGDIFTSARQAISKKPHPWNASINNFFQIVQNDNRFIFPGYVSDIELLALYKSAHANILVSHDEGFGFSFVEAGYQSTPSVLSRTPIFQETAGDSVLFVDKDNPNDIAEKIVQLFYDSVTREKMSIQAFDRAQQFNPQQFISGWNSVISNLQS